MYRARQQKRNIVIQGRATHHSERGEPLRFHDLLLLCLIPIASGSLAAQALTPREVMGCYDIRVGEWDYPGPEPLDSLRYHPPPRIEFDTIPLDRKYPGTGAFVVRPAPESRASRHPFAAWGIEGDTVRATWSTGFIGLTVSLTFEEDHLKGYALTFSDVVGNPRYRAEVEATPVSCSAAPDYPFSESQWVIRDVILFSGAVLSLGEPLPDSSYIIGKSSEFGYVLEGPAAGLFEGATLAKAGVPRHEVIETIRLEFPAGTDLDLLISKLAAAMGEPGHRYDLGEMQLVNWEDNTTTLSIAWTEGGVTINIYDPRLG